MANIQYGRQGDVVWGYFLKLADGKSVHAGTSVGPKETDLKSGDVFPWASQSGEFARVFEVMTGPDAKAMGYGVIVVLEEMSDPPTVN